MIGKRVNTPHGLGNVVDEDKKAYSHGKDTMLDGQKRWGVILDKPIFGDRPAYFVDKELTVDKIAEV